MLIPAAPVGMLSGVVGRWEGSSAATGDSSEILARTGPGIPLKRD